MNTFATGPTTAATGAVAAGAGESPSLEHPMRLSHPPESKHARGASGHGHGIIGHDYGNGHGAVARGGGGGRGRGRGANSTFSRSTLPSGSFDDLRLGALSRSTTRSPGISNANVAAVAVAVGGGGGGSGQGGADEGGRGACIRIPLVRSPAFISLLPSASASSLLSSSAAGPGNSSTYVSPYTWLLDQFATLEPFNIPSTRRLMAVLTMLQAPIAIAGGDVHTAQAFANAIAAANNGNNNNANIINSTGTGTTLSSSASSSINGAGGSASSSPLPGFSASDDAAAGTNVFLLLFEVVPIRTCEAVECVPSHGRVVRKPGAHCSLHHRCSQ